MAPEPHCVTLPTVSCGARSRLTPDDVASVRTWMTRFNVAIEGRDAAHLRNMVHPDAWVRDFLALSWDFRTIRGHDNILSYFSDNLEASGLRNLRLRSKGDYTPHVARPAPHVEWVAAMFDFDTAVGAGSGVVRLVDDGGEWKLFMISFMMQSLTDFHETTHLNRPSGGTNALGERGNWQEERERQKGFKNGDPTVLVIGAGQSGLNIAARLGQLGVSTLVVDKNPRVGDNWRNRYRTLVTHDPVQYTHMAYIPFPPSWPMFTPKDKLADWFEAYASLMELNVWTSTTISDAQYDDATGTWSVIVHRPNAPPRKMHPRHIVMATGHAGEALIPSFPGQDSFEGKLYHASAHQDASDADVKHKRVIVVGTGNSGHDICQNYYENGADVTMLQRGGTYVISASKGVFMLHKGQYDETSPPTADADVFGQSLPMPVQFALNTHSTARITETDREMLDGLARAGFEVDFGPQESGIFRKYMTRGGGYYINVGCSELIAGGKVKVKQAEGIESFTETGIVLKGGEEVAADVVVLATGYDNMRTTAQKILGKEADRMRDVWDLDEQGELNAIWRWSGHPGAWYIGGNLALCRIYSLLLALQIKACEEGLYKRPVD